MPTPLTRRQRTWRLAAAAVLVVLAALAAVVLSRYREARATASLGQCVYNMDQLGQAKDRLVYELRLKPGADIKADWLVQYVPGKCLTSTGALPACPLGPAYVLGPVDTDVLCPLHGTRDRYHRP